jgi:hypothetical protein
MAQRPPVQPPHRGGPPPPPRSGPPPRPGPPYPGPPYPGPPYPGPPPGGPAYPPPPSYLASAPTVPHRLPRMPRMPRRVPYGLVAGVAVIVFILITKPVILIQTVTTPFALLAVGAIVAGMLLLKPLLRALRLPAPARTGIVVGAWLVAGYLLVWPFYADYVFPAPVSQAAAPVTGGPSARGGAATAAVTGTFNGLDGHRGSGEASLIQVADGSYVVRLAGVDIGSGPDLRAYLVPGADQQSPGNGAVELGALGSSVRGDVNLQVPAGTTVEAGQPYTVLVWCRPFRVPVAGATLA